MPIKKTTKLNLENSEHLEKKVISKNIEKKDIKKKTKKVIVKRRKVELVPTKASAVAIVSQANRAKKQALIEKMESWKLVQMNRTSSWADSKIPLWVWIFFWCSLLLFCISFYHAVFRPAIEKNLITSNENSDIYLMAWDELWKDEISLQNNENVINSWNNDEIIQNSEKENIELGENIVIKTIQDYFGYLSNRQFEESSNFLISALKNSSEIKEHFTSFRMNPFLDWIEWWKLIPTDFNYVSTSTFWRDRYSFQISYVLKSNQEKYDETWEMVVDIRWDEPKITNIVCVTSKCSYHPIFWPENFGLMK